MAAQRAAAALSTAVDAAAASHPAEEPRAHVLLQGDGDPLLFLHGWGTSAADFGPVLPPLQRGRRLILPDLPGHGATPPPPAAWGVEEFAVWTAALLDRLGVERCDVVAHSNGGRVALLLAAQEPRRVRRLVLTSSAGIRSRHGLGHHLSVRTYKLLRRTQRARILPAGLRRRAEALANRRGSADYRSATGVMRGTMVRLVNFDARPLLPRVQAPVLLIWGSADSETPLQQARVMEHLIPDSGLVVFEGAGHFAYLEQPQRFCRIVDTFLDPDTS